MSRLWVPETARERMGRCNLCGFEGTYRDVQQHTVRCAREHMDEIRANAPSQRMSIFDERNWDPEWAEHQRRLGQRMLREGRWDIRPNER